MSEQDDHPSRRSVIRRFAYEYLAFVLALVVVASGLVALSNGDMRNEDASNFAYSAF
jgi:hypothetical protein